MAKMRSTLVLALASLSCLAYGPLVLAQTPLKSLAQAERLAVDLKQGMTLEEVQKLLGKPRRTALKQAYGGAPEGSLQWTYSWSSPSQSERNLQVVFATKSPEDWRVNGWDWTGY